MLHMRPGREPAKAADSWLALLRPGSTTCSMMGVGLASDLRVSTTGRKVPESTNLVNTDYTRLRLEGEVQNAVERH